MEGLPDDSCWFGPRGCPYHALDDPNDHWLLNTLRFCREATDAIPQKGEQPGGQEKVDFVISRESFQFACWIYGVKKLRDRREAISWVRLYVKAANQGVNYADEVFARRQRGEDPDFPEEEDG